MTLKMFGIVASLSAAALALSAGETFAKGKGAPAAVPFVTPGVPLGAKPFAHHHRRGFAGGLWPAGGYYYGGAPYGEPLAASSLPLPTDINYNYTYKQDVPWDSVHRFPPMVAPADRPYVSSCSTEVVTVPGRSGEQTVNVMRCY
ncbi:hypothetical protein [Bradyrhizobium sp.]|uniref:hypothetical protein n=1 Tax=Bradyrhizobium sp. TaxID=376 RepID=UPI001DFF1E59|nr:hypothetical protein [Bradyrhizobium sp.]MBI5320988.1 hypothetical protein [Bradyrhizobium sp.]